MSHGGFANIKVFALLVDAVRNVLDGSFCSNSYSEVGKYTGDYPLSAMSMV